jgi:hypothetical protein
MNGVPVANNNQNEKQQSDKKQTRGFRRVSRVTMILCGSILM